MTQYLQVEIAQTPSDDIPDLFKFAPVSNKKISETGCCGATRMDLYQRIAAFRFELQTVNAQFDVRIAGQANCNSAGTMKMNGGLSPLTLKENHAMNDAIFDMKSAR